MFPQNASYSLLDGACPLPKDCSFLWSTPVDWDTPCYDGEELFIQKAVLKRQREFRAGRNTARRCIAKLVELKLLKPTGIEGFDTIGVGESREPIWPKAVVGSISHTQFACPQSHCLQEYCAAVVAPKQCVASVGLDIEPIEHLAPDSLDLIVTANEWRRAKEHCWPRYWPKYLFAVKESFYKCLYPLIGVYLDFLEADFHLKAVQSVPGVYEVCVQDVISQDFKLTDEIKSRLRGYVFGHENLVVAICWLEL